MDLVVKCYQIAKQFPPHETYGLVSQIQRSAVSIPANIAEGKGREHLGDYLRHLSIANGSLMELETHPMIAERLPYLSSQELQSVLLLTGEIGRMLVGLRQKLKQKQSKISSSAENQNTFSNP